MSSKDTRDEPVLKNGKLNRRNMLLVGSTLAAASTLSSSPSAADQAGASGAYSNSAIAMMPPGKAVLASDQERVLGSKIARAMLSGPREITKDATVAEMGADGNLIILRQGTNDSICFAADSLFRLARALGFDGIQHSIVVGRIRRRDQERNPKICQRSTRPNRRQKPRSLGSGRRKSRLRRITTKSCWKV